MIRKKVVLGLILCCLIVFFCVYFCLGFIVKKVVVGQLEARFSTRVNLDFVDVTFFPFSVHFHDLKIINPKTPAEFLVVVDDIDVSLVFRKVFQRQFIVNNVDIQGVVFYLTTIFYLAKIVDNNIKIPWRPSLTHG